MQVPGSGLLLARALAPDEATKDQINLFAASHPIPADIGSTPPFFNANIDQYQHLDFLKLVFFYNEDMGIVAGSELPERKEAVRTWFTNLNF